MTAYCFGGLPGPGLSRFLNRSMSSSNQMKILRRPSPMKLIWFWAFCAYCCAVLALHPHNAAASLLVYIFIFAMIMLPAGAGNIPPLELLYLVIRSARRTASPAAINSKPMVPKSIDFTSGNGYGLRAGPYGPASLTNLTGQSGTVRNLRELRDRPRLQAAPAGPSKQNPSHPITSCGLIPPSVYYYYITSGIICQAFCRKIIKKSRISGIKNILSKSQTHQEAVC